MTINEEILFAQQQVIRLQALLEASRQIHATTDLEMVLHTTLQIVVQELELEGAFFTRFPQTYGTIPEIILQFHREAPATTVGESFDVLRYPLYDKQGELFTEIVVLTSADRVLTLDETDFIEGLSLQAAVAIENARFHERTILLAQVREEREKARQLLLNILPEAVAEALQNGEDVTKYFEDATICFTDFVGFTNSTENMPATILVKELHTYFKAFDKVITRYGLEKLKTIGDSYMFVGGLPGEALGTSVTAVLAALEIADEVRQLAARPNSPCWQIRVGLHTGPVIAGVVGIRKFAFDIWGHSVNFASRMESSGVPGKINISESTYTRINQFFTCEERGIIRTKDKRDVKMFLVQGIQPHLISNGKATAFEMAYEECYGCHLPAFPQFLLANAQ